MSVKSKAVEEAKNSWVREIRSVRQSYCLTRPEFASLLGRSDRTLAKWESGEREPGRDDRRRYEELRRLHEGLGTIMRVAAIRPWLEKANSAFGGQVPLDLIRNGKIDLIWQMIFQLQSSPSL